MKPIYPILLTIILEEGFHSRVEGRGFDKQRPYEFHELGGKLVKSRHPGVRDYVTNTIHKVRITTIPEASVKFFISDEAIPQHRCNARMEWKKWNQTKRLEYYLSSLAEGKSYYYSSINPDKT